MKFLKKPVVIEAVQWFKAGDHPKVYVHQAARYGVSEVWVDGQAYIDTLEGRHIVCPGDWIITGVKGEHYPCKPDIFAATYEPVDDVTPPTTKGAIAAKCQRIEGSGEICGLTPPCPDCGSFLIEVSEGAF